MSFFSNPPTNYSEDPNFCCLDRFYGARNPDTDHWHDLLSEEKTGAKTDPGCH
jgi:hypothetical protein